MRTWLLMFKRYLIAVALIAGLATPANAQAPGALTKVGMLRCILDPSVRLYYYRPRVDAVLVRAERRRSASL